MEETQSAEMPENDFNPDQYVRRIEDAEEKVRVSPLDVDFVVVLLMVAIPFDILFACLEILSFFTVQIPKIISIPANVLAFAIICGWSIWRTGQRVKAREAQKKSLEKALKKQSAALQKQLAKQTAKMGMRVVSRRIIIRGAIAFLGSIIPLISFFPFWTLTVVLTLREK